MDREIAWQLLNEYTKNPALIIHALCVEAAMRAYARKFGEHEQAWGTIGLLHDFDYERFPTEDGHPFEGVKLLRARGVPDDWLTTILSHCPYTNVPRTTRRDKTLFAIDELAGFLVAATLVRPDRKIADLPVKSVRKKMKQKAFAAQVSREDITSGAEDLGVDLDDHIGFVIAALTSIADRIGL